MVKYERFTIPALPPAHEGWLWRPEPIECTWTSKACVEQVCNIQKCIRCYGVAPYKLPNTNAGFDSMSWSRTVTWRSQGGVALAAVKDFVAYAITANREKGIPRTIERMTHKLGPWFDEEEVDRLVAIAYLES